MSHIYAYGPLSEAHISLINIIKNATPMSHPHYFHTAPHKGDGSQYGRDKQRKILKAIFGNTENINHPTANSPLAQVMNNKQRDNLKIVVTQENRRYKAQCLASNASTFGTSLFTLNFSDILLRQQMARLYYDESVTIEAVKQVQQLKAGQTVSTPSPHAAYLSTTIGPVKQYFAGNEGTLVDRVRLLADIKYPNLNLKTENQRYCQQSSLHKHFSFTEEGFENFITDIKAIVKFNMIAAHKHGAGLDLIIPTAFFRRLNDDDKQKAKQAFLSACINAALELSLNDFAGLVLHGDGDDGELTKALNQKLSGVNSQLTFPVFVAQGLDTAALHLAASENHIPLAFAESIQGGMLDAVGNDALSGKANQAKNARDCRESAGESALILSSRYNPFIDPNQNPEYIAIPSQSPIPLITPAEESSETLNLDTIEDRRKLSSMLFDHFSYDVTIQTGDTSAAQTTKKQYRFVLENLSTAENFSSELKKQFSIGSAADSNKAKKTQMYGNNGHCIYISASDCNKLFNALKTAELKKPTGRKHRKADVPDDAEGTSNNNVSKKSVNASPSKLGMYAQPIDPVKIQQFEAFKNAYLKSHNEATFKKSNKMKAKLDSGEISTLKQVINYALEKPLSRSAEVLATLDFIDDKTAFIIAYFKSYQSDWFTKKTGMMSLLNSPEKRKNISMEQIQSYAIKKDSRSNAVLTEMNNAKEIKQKNITI